MSPFFGFVLGDFFPFPTATPFSKPPFTVFRENLDALNISEDSSVTDWNFCFNLVKAKTSPSKVVDSLFYFWGQAFSHKTSINN